MLVVSAEMAGNGCRDKGNSMVGHWAVSRVMNVVSNVLDPDPWIRTLDYGSDSGSGSCSFCEWLSRWQQKIR
jgi:hypothetical protein